ncbi:hypothetical protein DIPPA_11551 [Diplonema papillatum]|nr:hypothetical protein DIPPA_11551 [Diplonema papillatum]
MDLGSFLAAGSAVNRNAGGRDDTVELLLAGADASGDSVALAREGDHIAVVDRLIAAGDGARDQLR